MKPSTHNIPWAKIGLRIFPTLSQAERYCRRKGLSEDEIEYDPQKEQDAYVMAAQQIAILNEAQRQIETRYQRYKTYLDAAIEARNSAQAEIEKGNPYPAVFNLPKYDRDAQECVSKLEGMSIALDEIENLFDELESITLGRISEPNDIKKESVSS